MAPVLTRFGSNNNVTGTAAQNEALFLKVFTGEILTAFQEAHIMKDVFRERSISSGKSAQFVYTGKASATYFQPGQRTDELANQMPVSEQTILIDDLLISSAAVYDLDAMKSHYDIRGEYSKQLGQALAREYDNKLARTAILAARSTNKITGLPGGTVIDAGAAVETDGNVLAASIYEAVQSLDEKDVPKEGRNLFLRPAQYYALVQAKDTINSDWGGLGMYSEGTIVKIAGVPITSYNRLPNSNYTAVAGENNSYVGDFTNTVALLTSKEAVGTVKLMDMQVEQSGADYHIVHQSDLFLAKYACGHGILRPECSVEITKV